MDEVKVSLPERCSGCTYWLVGSGEILYALETEMPGFEEVGDPSKVLGWHHDCAPDWLREEVRPARS